MSQNIYQAPQSNINQETTSSAGLSGEITGNSIGTGMFWISESWRLFKAQPGVWIGMFIVYFIIMIILSMIPLVNMFTGIVTPVFTGGWMIAAAQCDQSNSAKLDHLFAGFSQYATPLFLVGLISIGLEIGIVVIVAAIGIPLIGMDGLMSTFSHPETLAAENLQVFMLLLLVYMALLLPVVMMLWFAPVLVVQHQLQPWDAMVKSFFGCLKNVLPYLLFSIVYMVLIVIAMIPLFLGLLVVIPMFMLSMYTAYKSIYLR